MFRKLLLLMACMVFVSAAYALPLEALNLGGKEWKLGFKDENTRSKIMEFVTNDESVDRWTELVTVQLFKNVFPHEVTPIFFADTEVASLKAKGLKYIYTPLKVSDQEALIEFRVSQPSNQQQDELQRIVKNSQGQLIVFHYAIKKQDMGQEQRAAWVDALQSLDPQSFLN